MEQMKLTFVNVGYGEAMVVECPDPSFQDSTFVMVIDGGSAEAAEFADRSSGRLPLTDYLAARGIAHIDLMVGTHIHEDHVSGLLSAAKLLLPAVLWQSLPAEAYRRMHILDVSLAESDSQRKLIQSLNDYQFLCHLTKERGGVLRTLGAGDSGSLCQGLKYRLFAPSPARRDELISRCVDLFTEENDAAFLQKLSALDTRMNNFSLILRLDYRGTRLLLPGDTNAQGYSGIEPESLRAHLFKVGHHGQKDGVNQELLEAIRPQAAVCCASSDRRYGSADPEMLRLLAENGASLYFSDCPQLPGLDIPPHQALTFTVGEGGAISAEYLSI